MPYIQGKSELNETFADLTLSAWQTRGQAPTEASFSLRPYLLLGWTTNTREFSIIKVGSLSH